MKSSLVTMAAFGAILWLAVCFAEIQPDLGRRNSGAKKAEASSTIWGNSTSGLQPFVNCEFYTESGWNYSQGGGHYTQSGWNICVGFNAQLDFPSRTWLKVTNQVWAKLKLFYTNGTELISKSSDLRNAFYIPIRTTVEEIRFHTSYGKNRRAYQWLNVGDAVTAGYMESTGDFDLGLAFNMPTTNDYLLKVSPLIYKVETNLVDVHLIEFPEIRILLKSNGSGEQVK
jgi:hypothetical protein